MRSNRLRFRDPSKLEVKKEIKETLQSSLELTDIKARLLTLDVLEMAAHYFNWVLGDDMTEAQRERWERLSKHDKNDKW